MNATLVAITVFVALLATAWLAQRARAGTPVAGGASVFAPAAGANPVTGAIGRLARPSDPGEIHLQRQFLAQAGFRSPNALSIYLAARSLSALILPALGAFIAPPKGLAGGFLLLLALASLGYYLPLVVVRVLRDVRQTEVRKVLPDALDMLVSCLESGLGLDAALRHVGHELRLAAPEFGGEIELVNAELQAGIPRAEALVHLDQRVGVDDITALVGVLSQAERYGAGIAESVRAHAQMSRRRRILDAERRAAEAAPKLTVVMILFVLPPLFVVLIGPTVVHVVTRLLPMLEGR